MKPVNNDLILREKLITGIINFFLNHKRINESRKHIGGYKTEYKDH